MNAEQQNTNTKFVEGYVIEDVMLKGKAFRYSPMIEMPQYKAMDAMRINQSISFKMEEKKNFMAAQQVFHARTEKRFMLRKVDSFNCRIFRIADMEIGKRRIMRPRKKEILNQQ